MIKKIVLASLTAIGALATLFVVLLTVLDNEDKKNYEAASEYWNW